MLELRDRLLRMFGNPKAAQEWIQSTSRYLGGFTPLESVRRAFGLGSP
ncbi:MAG TPA: antitoxin Xre/MbcA/ParS toxin-binding domain-containing protein [Chloroflexota bacterium]|nr:antitoxin Xre/MbcA/ParS toxin-binding domain-containing protein [Chloroflexota bacterium]